MSDVAYKFVLIEPAAIMGLAKKYNLGLYTEGSDDAPKAFNW